MNINAEKRHQLKPFAVVSRRAAFETVLDSDVIKQNRKIQNSLPNYSATDTFAMDGYCLLCSSDVSFLVDMKFGGRQIGGRWVPNWRERLQCPLCKMNNKQRLIASLVKQEVDRRIGKNIYFMEQVTPIFKWAKATFTRDIILGSEFLGYEHEGGTVIKGLRHEDIENLSFKDELLDLIVSNDVFEHIPHPLKAFTECYRALKNAGTLLATFPFHKNQDRSIIRATLTNGQVEHLLPPLYHGSPISPEGSLVFTDFGWDVLDQMKKAGFAEVNLEIYASPELGHLGEGQLIFRAKK